MRARSAVAATCVVVLVLVAAAVVADVALRRVTEERIAAQLQDSFGAGTDTRVSIATHRPFLLQLARGRLDEVDVVAGHLAFDQGEVTDVTARAAAVAVRAPSVASDVTATGTVPLATVRQSLTGRGLDVAVAVDGSQLTASGSVLGVPWDAALTPRVAGGRLTVDLASADLAGVRVAADSLPSAIRDSLAGLEVPVSGLPAGLTLTDARVVPGGVQVTLAGRDVALDQD